MIRANIIQAELILSEINFPTDSIKERIQTIDDKIREQSMMVQVELEKQLKKEREEREFQQKIALDMKIKQEELMKKKIELQKREDLKKLFEARRNEAFNILEEAEIRVSQGNYDLALENYNEAELILNQIQFPTESLREMKNKVQEKKRQKELEKQREMEMQIKKDIENLEFQKQISDSLLREKSRLKFKQITLQKKEELRKKSEIKKNQAFYILEDAENLTKNGDYDAAIEKYRNSMLILNEIQYPTDSIETMIRKVNILKEQERKERELKYKKELG